MNFKKQLLVYYYNWYYSFTEYMLLMLGLTPSPFIKHVSYTNRINVNNQQKFKRFDKIIQRLAVTSISNSNTENSDDENNIEFTSSFSDEIFDFESTEWKQATSF